MPDTDYSVEWTPSFYLVHSNTTEALEHLQRNVATESTWDETSLVVEHHYLEDLLRHLEDDGFTVAY